MASNSSTMPLVIASENGMRLTTAMPPPASIDVDRVTRAAVCAARALGIRDYGRLDFRVSPDGTPWFIEASTHPHIQRHSSFFVLARQHSMEYHEMLDMLIQIATRRARLSEPVYNHWDV